VYERPVTKEFIYSVEEKTCHKTFQSEEQLFDCVKSGDVSRIESVFDEFMSKGLVGIYDKNDKVRHTKNVLITICSIATRAAMSAGYPCEIAYKISDLFIQSIEEREIIVDGESMAYAILLEFTMRVKKFHQKNLSAVIIKCQDYIYTNVYKKLTIKQIASTLNISSCYLSTKFKKETGFSLNDYVQRAKIEESKMCH